MSHKEKVAWLALIGMVVTYGPYFVLTAMQPPPVGDLPNIQQLIRYGVCALAYLAIYIVGRVVLRLMTPKDERGPADERDRAIERRSMQVGYYVLIGGMMWVGVVMPFVTGGWAIVNAALAAIVIAELVQNGVAVAAYRRDGQ